MHKQAETRPTGHLDLRVVRARQPKPAAVGHPLSLLEIIEHGFPQRGLPEEVNDWRSDNSVNMLRAIRRQLRGRRAARKFGLAHFWAQLWLTKIDAAGRRLDLGLASMRLVTDNGVAFIVDAFTNAVEAETMNFHGIGTTNTAEAQTDSALAAEITTQYNPDNTRATGAQSQPSANIYRTVGTNTVDAAVAAVEHGVFDQAATGGGVLLDRSVFSVVNLANGDSLESTYDLTIAAGG